MTMAMAAAALGVKQIARTKERESDWAARVRQGREEGVGASSYPLGESGDGRHRTRGRHGMAATIPPPPVARLGMRWRWAGPMLLDGPKCIMALEPINT